MEKREKKLDTQIKAKANEEDLSELKCELKADMTDLVTSEDLENLQQEVSATTKEVVNNAMQELEVKMSSEEDIKKLSRKNWRQAENQTEAQAPKVKPNPNKLNRAAKH